jgi:hypothetical protein
MISCVSLGTDLQNPPNGTIFIAAAGRNKLPVISNSTYNLLHHSFLLIPPQNSLFVIRYSHGPAASIGYR